MVSRPASGVQSVGGEVTRGRVSRHAAGAGLVSKLMADVRPEFRVDVCIPEPGELIFGLGACRVPGCPRQPRTRQLCRGHYYHWQRRENRMLKSSSLAPDRSDGRN